MEQLERVWLACDVSSLWDSCRDAFGDNSRINFEVLKYVVPALRGGIDKVQMNANAYIVTHKRHTHKTFSDVLTSLEYVVKLTEVDYVTHKNRPTPVHDDWTSGITLDAVYWIDSYDTFVLAAGCRQFEKLLNFLRANGKNIIVLTFKSEYTEAVYSDYADEVHYLTEDIVY